MEKFIGGLETSFFGACYWNPIDIKKKRLIGVIFAVSNSLASQCPRVFSILMHSE